MKSKLLIIQLTIFMLFCASCAKHQSLGTGVSVDKQGNLKIDAPIYVINPKSENPKFIRAPSSMNYDVYAGIDDELRENRSRLEIKGGIIKGHLSITIKKPDNYMLNKAYFYREVPEDIIKSGEDTLTGELVLTVDNPDDYMPIILFNDKNVKATEHPEFFRFNMDNDRFAHIFSLGDVILSGENKSEWNWPRFTFFDINLKQGWNIVRYGEYLDDTLQDIVGKRTSNQPSSKAIWVLLY